jgi:hypothetical protein
VGFQRRVHTQPHAEDFVEEMGVGYEWLIDGVRESKIPFAVKKKQGGQELKSDDD